MTEYYRGSLDPFDDIAEQLDGMGVAYLLVIGQSGSNITNSWDNLAHWGAEGLDNIASAVQDVVDERKAEFEEDGEEDAG